MTSTWKIGGALLVGLGLGFGGGFITGAKQMFHFYCAKSQETGESTCSEINRAIAEHAVPSDIILPTKLGSYHVAVTTTGQLQRVTFSPAP